MADENTSQPEMHDYGYSQSGKMLSTGVYTGPEMQQNVSTDATDQQSGSSGASCPLPKVPAKLAGLAKGLAKKGKGRGGKSKGLKGGTSKDKNWTTSKYGQGPYFPATASFAAQPEWNQALQSGAITEQEKQTIQGMARNEGGTNAVQGYDSQIASVGPMQKTINQKGQGEFPLQVEAFAKNNPQLYQQLFADKGWTIQHNKITTKSGKVVLDPNPTMYYQDPNNPNMKPITGKALKAYLLSSHQTGENALKPLVAAAGNPEFVKQMIQDFKTRLNSAISTNVNGHPISAYLTSPEGRALVLDESVNVPGYVKKDFQKALNRFYKDNPDVPKDPAKWDPAQRANYENQIIDDYKYNRRMTNPALRANNISKYFHPPKPKG